MPSSSKWLTLPHWFVSVKITCTMIDDWFNYTSERLKQNVTARALLCRGDGVVGHFDGTMTTLDSFTEGNVKEKIYPFFPFISI